MMKKHFCKIIATSFLALSACMLLSTPVKASVKNFTEKSSTTLSASVDVTGDGKADSIKIKTSRDKQNDFVTKLNVYVNSKLAYTKKFTNKYNVLMLKGTYAMMSNSKEFIQLIGIGPNDYIDYNSVLKYDTKKSAFVSVKDFDVSKEHAHEIIAADKNQITFDNRLQPNETGWLQWTLKYSYGNNKLNIINETSSDVKSLLVNKMGKVDNYYKLFRKNQFVTAKQLSFYNGAKLSYTVKKGTTVTLKKITCSNGKFYLQFQYKNKTGWISVCRPNYDYDHPFFESVTERLAG